MDAERQLYHAEKLELESAGGGRRPFRRGKRPVAAGALWNDASKLANDAASQPNDGPKKSRIPKWITDFFWSPKD